MQIRCASRSVFTASVAAMALCVAPTSSVAAVFTNVYEGYVIDGQDPAGIFGDSLNLDGLAVEIRMSFDSDVNRFTLPGEDDVVITSGGLSPFVAASVTIEGATYDFTPPAPAEAFTSFHSFDSSYEQDLQLASNHVDGATALSLNVAFNSFLLPASLDTPFDLTRDDVFKQFGGFFFTGRYDELLGGDVGDAAGLVSFTHAYTLTDLPVSGAPEPAAWLTMIFGFAAAGAAVRRSRRARVALT